MNMDQDRTARRDPHPSPPRKGEGARGLARELRRNATPAECKLWQELRLLKSEGRPFRRQVPLGAFIADFACFHPKLVIEIDGGQHGTAESIASDEKRTQWLASQGFTVLRFWNVDIFANLEGVLDMIRNACGLETSFGYGMAGGGAVPTPDPFSQGGGA